MPSLSNLLEDYRNWRGRQEWEQGKGWQDFFGGDPRAQEQFEKLSGFGTDAGGLVGMIKASHGSPHMFDKFDFSKIGTGEGAQAYGHGGYFAQGFDSPVAQQYREALSGGAKKAVNASFSDDPELWVAGQLHSGIKPSEITEGLTILGYEGNPSDLIKSAQNRLKDELNSGHLYNVELKWPDAAREAADPLGEHHLLDWDAPLSEQSPFIQNIINKNFPPKTKEEIQKYKELYDEALDNYYRRPMAPHPDELDELESAVSKRYSDWQEAKGINSAAGSLIYHKLAENKPYAEASALLRDLGIPGIRYLDQGSRSAGTGSRNYVMFDDQFPEIVSRNGVSLSDLLRR